MTAVLLLSCSKQDENDDNPTSTRTYENLDALFESMGQRQKLYVDIAPVELPSYIKESNDSMMQKIVSMAALIDSSREKAIFPAFTSSTGSIKSAEHNVDELLKSMNISTDGDWIEECFLQDTPFWFCRSTKWENDGKLEIIFTQQNSPDAWISHIVLIGEHSDGTVYDTLMIQYWITLKDLTYSEYTYSTIFYPKPPCGPNILWRFISEVEGDDAWLHYMGEARSLATYIYTSINYSCGILEDYHHVNFIRELKILPDDKETVIFTTAIYSLNLHDVYKWVVYVVMNDGCWIETVYNEDGTVKERTQSELCD